MQTRVKSPGIDDGYSMEGRRTTARRGGLGAILCAAPKRGAWLLAALALTGCTSAPPARSMEALRQQVVETERAFARTMAVRDHAGFVSFLSKEAVFFSGETPLRGAEVVAARWKKFYEEPAAPFSWEPEKVEVLDSGALALSSGPVRDPSGNLVATFTSIWRLEAGGWRIVFDKGNDVCPKAP